jgi:hypothetical protein
VSALADCGPQTAPAGGCRGSSDGGRSRHRPSHPERRAGWPACRCREPRAPAMRPVLARGCIRNEIGLFKKAMRAARRRKESGPGCCPAPHPCRRCAKAMICAAAVPTQQPCAPGGQKRAPAVVASAFPNPQSQPRRRFAGRACNMRHGAFICARVWVVRCPNGPLCPCKPRWHAGHESARTQVQKPPRVHGDSRAHRQGLPAEKKEPGRWRPAPASSAPAARVEAQSPAAPPYGSWLAGDGCRAAAARGMIARTSKP